MHPDDFSSPGNTYSLSSSPTTARALQTPPPPSTAGGTYPTSSPAVRDDSRDGFGEPTYQHVSTSQVGPPSFWQHPDVVEARQRNAARSSQQQLLQPQQQQQQHQQQQQQHHQHYVPRTLGDARHGLMPSAAWNDDAPRWIASMPTQLTTQALRSAAAATAAAAAAAAASGLPSSPTTAPPGSLPMLERHGQGGGGGGGGVSSMPGMTATAAVLSDFGEPPATRTSVYAADESRGAAYLGRADASEHDMHAAAEVAAADASQQQQQGQRGFGHAASLHRRSFETSAPMGVYHAGAAATSSSAANEFAQGALPTTPAWASANPAGADGASSSASSSAQTMQPGGGAFSSVATASSPSSSSMASSAAAASRFERYALEMAQQQQQQQQHRRGADGHHGFAPSRSEDAAVAAAAMGTARHPQWEVEASGAVGMRAAASYAPAQQPLASGEVSTPPRRTKKRTIRPQACTYPGCGAVLSSRAHARRHERIHFSDARYCCPHDGCTSSFSRKDSCSYHQRGRHGSILEPRVLRVQNDYSSAAGTSAGFGGAGGSGSGTGGFQWSPSAGIDEDLRLPQLQNPHDVPRGAGALTSVRGEEMDTLPQHFEVASSFGQYTSVPTHPPPSSTSSSSAHQQAAVQQQQQQSVYHYQHAHAAHPAGAACKHHDSSSPPALSPLPPLPLQSQHQQQYARRQEQQQQQSAESQNRLSQHGVPLPSQFHHQQRQHQVPRQHQDQLHQHTYPQQSPGYQTLGQAQHQHQYHHHQHHHRQYQQQQQQQHQHRPALQPQQQQQQYHHHAHLPQRSGGGGVATESAPAHAAVTPKVESASSEATYSNPPTSPY